MCDLHDLYEGMIELKFKEWLKNMPPYLKITYQSVDQAKNDFYELLRKGEIT